MSPTFLAGIAAGLLAFGLVVAWLLRAIGHEQRIGQRLLMVQRVG
jgi:hypothetical protein